MNVKILNLTDYRCLASYVLALIELQHRSEARLVLRLQTGTVAEWLAARLKQRGYAVLGVDAAGNEGLLTVSNQA